MTRDRIVTACVAIAAYSLVMLAIVAKLGPPIGISGFWLLGLSVVLIAITTIDVEQMRIPDMLNGALIGLGLLVAASVGRSAVFWAIVSAVVGAGSFGLVRYAYARLRGVHGLGLGDVKFMAGAGAWAGMEQLPFVVLVAAITALASVLIFAAWRGVSVDQRTPLPFGPYLAFGLWCIVVAASCER